MHTCVSWGAFRVQNSVRAGGCEPSDVGAVSWTRVVCKSRATSWASPSHFWHRVSHGGPLWLYWLVSDSPSSACPNLPGSRHTDSLCLLQLFCVHAGDPVLAWQTLDLLSHLLSSVLQNLPQGFKIFEAGSGWEVRGLVLVQLASSGCNRDRKKVPEKVCLTEAVWAEEGWNSSRSFRVYV